MRSLIHLFSTPGVPLAAILVFLEQIGLPVPAMPALVAAGALARDGRLSAPLLLFASLVCTLTADAAWYAVGRRWGGRAIHVIGKVALSAGTRAKAEALVGRFPPTTLLFAKFVPGLSVISVPLAGASRMPLTTFFLYDGAGALLWAGGGIALGVLLHHQVERALAALAALSRGGLTVVAAAVVAYAVWHLAQRRRVPEFVLRRISPDDVAARLHGEDALEVFDARTERTRHLDGRVVPGSRPLRVGALEEDLDGVPKDREIVLYCRGEETAVRVARLLQSSGFEKVHLLDGGLDAWAEAGHPVVRLETVPRGDAR